MKFKITYYEIHTFKKEIDAPDLATAKQLADGLVEDEIPTNDNGWSDPEIDFDHIEVEEVEEDPQPATPGSPRRGARLTARSVWPGEE